MAVRGVLIGTRVLADLGFAEEPKGSGRWCLLSNGYFFQFRKSGRCWVFGLEGEPGHSVTHLEECFGFLADDMFRAGRADANRGMRKALGIASPLEAID